MNLPLQMNYGLQQPFKYGLDMRKQRNNASHRARKE